MSPYKTNPSKRSEGPHRPRLAIPLSVLCLAMLLAGGNLYAQWGVRMETGLPFQTYNEVGIPNETGTRFDLTDDFETDGIVIPLRVRLERTFAERNRLMALYAPLTVNYTSLIPFDIRFAGVDFEQGEDVDALYRFNSYRLTYLRLFTAPDRDLQFGAGFTAKIRDARVRLGSGELTGTKNDFGFVPLLHVFASYRSGQWVWTLEADGLAGGPGRAFDVYAGLGRQISGRFLLQAGYRLLEGGADVPEVYNFAMFHFASAGVFLRF